MAPKGKTSQREDLKQEDILQAVVIADSFNVRFGPVTERRPRTLLPLVNVPLLDYTLEFLYAAGVQEVFVFCCHLADQIRTHIKNSKWNDSSSPMQVSPILSDGCMSVGDALREIDSKSLVRSDFILVSGDIISNINLKKILEEHKKRREKDKSSVMTLVCKKAPPGHRTRCSEDEILVAVESDTNRVLHYQKAYQQNKFHIPVSVFVEHTDVDVRYDMLDSQVCICTPLVPQLYTDNFDYQSRDDFVRGILISEEILGNTIHLAVVRDEYAARISNLQMYDAVSLDVMNRWTYPLVPDGYMTCLGRDVMSYGRHNVYLSKDITLARGCVLAENVVIGSGTSVGNNTNISNSVIGKNCQIGENVKIAGSYLWDGVVVEDNCIIETALLCSNVSVHKEVTICPGAVLAWEVKVGPSVTLPAGCQLISKPQVDEFADEEETPPEPDVTPEFGSQSKAFVYRASCDSDDEDEDLVQDMWGLTVQSEEEDDDISSIDSDVTDQDDISPSGSPIPDDAGNFYSEVIDTLIRAKEDNIITDNIILEINSLKHAYNIAINEVHQLVMKALLSLPLQNTKAAEVTQVMKILRPHLSKHSALIKNYIKSAEAQFDCLQAIEELSESNSAVSCAVMKLLHFLYDQEILDEQAIIKWHAADPEPDADLDAHKDIRKKVAPLITWLKEAEEESSEED
ncbi:translation initiation factor eIF2B subunit epsilon-like isoform X1 [Haliotis cracherodii]|uniref:translation initiation factor eIF2B subunit epsilon-like isoform X1 n=1 Tax=Haliotis cracherodii TaxID=6455 RepID=UPI0039EBFAB7